MSPSLPGLEVDCCEPCTGAGGLTGQGWRQGTQTTLNLVPEQQTDFIFTALAEEFGFVGGASLVAIYGYNMDSAEGAAWHGIEPLMWLLFGMGFLLKFYAFVDQFVQPFISISIFVLSVRHVVRGDLMTFMSIFLIFIGKHEFAKSLETFAFRRIFP